ncbi:MAG TPA: glycosyltransferase family 4 protein [Solirubrobacteraceae bacterium]|nr:glycosyltransferase family 4 protein [Solirubrobacteraceae bacterium]
MRVLLLHNRYRLPGGEERAVDEIARLLRDHGHVVSTVARSSEQTSSVTAARRLLSGGEDISAEIAAFRPDVVHAHNLHPLLGWRALASAKRAGSRTVLHLHNFRLVCAIGIAYRDGAPCHRCHGRNTFPGIRLNCRDSRAEALTYGIGLRRQQPHLLRHADALVVVSAATAERLEQFGIPAATPLPNFVREPAQATSADQGTHALASGRLVLEKGFDTAISAARAADVPLVVVGEGPDQARLKALAAGADVRFTGRVSEAALADLRRTAVAQLVPSRWEEPCPYSVLDAMAAGVPVLASDIGGLPELVGETVADGEWADALATLWRDPEQRRQRGEAGLQRARERHSAEGYYNALMETYGCEP